LTISTFCARSASISASKPRRIVALFVLLFICFLALYTWDARTGKLSGGASLGGLEVTGYILGPGVWFKDQVFLLWDGYFDLTDVAAENVKLREELAYLRQEQDRLQEDVKELTRLRSLLDLPDIPGWERTGARVLAGRFGPQAALNSVMINKGFMGGASAGTPVVTRSGLAGRVFHASPNSANVLLLNDPTFRVAVIGQQSRVRGILAGAGAGQPLEVMYVAPNTDMREGELLICSGIDGGVPKGVPAARVTRVVYDQDTLFPQITAEPLAELERLEEVVLLVLPRGQHTEDLVFTPYQEIERRAGADGGITDEEAARNIGN
jgi:rod shape-determining protein MreC